MAPTLDSLKDFFAQDPGPDLLARFDASKTPRHVAIIMDGNGRWAVQRGMPRLAGHRAAVKAVREAIATALELGVEYLTLYSFSSENWSRPADEVSGLMRLFVDVLDREIDNLQDLGVRVTVAGRTCDLPPKTAAAFARTERDTASNHKMTLVVALNYGGRAELVDAVRGVVGEVCSGTLDESQIDEAAIERHLYTAGIPDPDLMIRTSGEMRVSNFLLWQMAYAEFWVTDVFWPDFDRLEFLRGVLDYQRRERRFGGS